MGTSFFLNPTKITHEASNIIDAEGPHCTSVDYSET